MSEELLNNEPTEVVPQDIESGEEEVGRKIEGEAKPPSKWEVSAREAGWVPLEEWQGDPDDWTDAREFVKRGELFHKISNQSGEIKELRKAISGLMEHHQKVKETEFKRALDYLKQQKKAALEEGDADKLLAVDDAIDTLKEEQQAAKEEVVEQKAAGPTPTFVEWVKQNAWYVKDPELRAFADEIGVGVFQTKKGQISEEDLYKLVKQRVVKAFPEKFKGQGTKTPNVEGGNIQTRNTRADDFVLSPLEKQTMNTFVRAGAMTKEQYIEELKRVKGVA